jgi:predicted DNA-binding protein (MmcQ/YjbR family)
MCRLVGRWQLVRTAPHEPLVGAESTDWVPCWDRFLASGKTCGSKSSVSSLAGRSIRCWHTWFHRGRASAATITVVNLERLRRHCLSLPHATEQVQWGNDLVFKVAGKMFAVACLDTASPHKLSFKCEPEIFAELTERPGIVPAPYMARAQWVALEEFDALSDREIEDGVAGSYRLVFGRLPKKRQRELSPGKPTRAADVPRRARASRPSSQSRSAAPAARRSGTGTPTSESTRRRSR